MRMRQRGCDDVQPGWLRCDGLYLHGRLQCHARTRDRRRAPFVRRLRRWRPEPLAVVRVRSGLGAVGFVGRRRGRLGNLHGIQLLPRHDEPLELLLFVQLGHQLPKLRGPRRHVRMECQSDLRRWRLRRRLL
jgi:hypothetical protein